MLMNMNVFPVAGDMVGVSLYTALKPDEARALAGQLGDIADLIESGKLNVEENGGEANPDQRV